MSQVTSRSELLYGDAKDADWLMSEAFCLYEDRDRFKPYEKHHSTVLDAARLAERLHVRNLILYHTEDRTLETRKQRYTAEADYPVTGAIFAADKVSTRYRYGLFHKKKITVSLRNGYLPFGRDYCPTSRKIHLILLNSIIFYVV